MMDRKPGFTADHHPQDRFTQEPGPAIRRTGLSGAENRGRRAPQEGSGVVIGSGASAGGGGGREDLDHDAAGGGGKMPANATEHRAPKDK